jgi:hypothetical protein
MERARQNVRIARYAIGIAAAAGLAAFAAVARASHPGTSHPSRASSTVSTADSSDDDGSFFGDDSSSSGFYSNIGPSGSAAPQIQSGGS